MGICNAALRRLGATPITSLTEGSKSANSIRDFYEETRDELLRSHPWNYARSRQKLAQLATAPAFGFDYAYGLPSDWMRTVGVHDNDGGFGTIEYSEEIQGGQGVILASSSEVYLSYVALITDPNRMPADVRKALSRLLAAAAAIDLTKSNTIREACEEEAKALVRRAKSADAQGSSPVRRPQGSWAASRGGRWR